MKISIIVPFWNSEKWIGKCCESLLKQEGDFEFILVDDNSTDQGDEVIYNYCDIDPRFVLLRNVCSKGVSGARNTGLDYADGDLITFLDADDELLDNVYEIFVNTVDRDPIAKIYQFNHLRYYANIGKTTFKYTNGRKNFDISYLPNMWFSVWNKLYDAEFIKDIRFDERLQYGEDGLFILECLTRGAYIYHAYRNAVTVKHNFVNAQSLSKEKTAEDILKQIHIYEEFYLKQKDLVAKKTICNEIAQLWSVRMIKRIEEEYGRA